MTGEMSYSTIREEGYGFLFNIARKINCNTGFSTAVKPFDVYQGAYIAVSFDKNGKYHKDGRDLGSWNAEVWCGEGEDSFYIKYKGMNWQSISERFISHHLRKLVNLR